MARGTVSQTFQRKGRHGRVRHVPWTPGGRSHFENLHRCPVPFRSAPSGGSATSAAVRWGGVLWGQPWPPRRVELRREDRHREEAVGHSVP
eukprot:3682291-Pyramimonas_sp.AAC.1